MNKQIFKLSVHLLIFFSTLLFINPLFANQTLKNQIEEIVKSSRLDLENTSIAIGSVNTKNITTSINGNLALNPASCTKILTAITAFETLGPNYRFETVFLSDTLPTQTGEIKNLYIWGNGDPSLVSEKLWKMTNNLKNKGLKTISGDITIDNSYYDGSWYPRKDGNDEFSYTAPTSAVSANFNSVSFILSPANTKEGKATVVVDPPTDYIKIINKLKIGKKNNINIIRTNINEAQETFKITGHIKKGSAPFFVYRKINNPQNYASSVFKYLLKQNGVSFTGQIKRGKIPAHAKEISREKSKPLTEIIKDMMKFSNNFIAEQLVKHMGAVKKGLPGNTSKGISVIKDYLGSIGISPETYTIENGSGLTNNNKISAEQIVKILVSAYNDFHIQPDFLSSLSILGVDGTMKSWKYAPKLRGKLRAKTGSLSDVIALAGYVPDKNGEIIAFAIICNDFKQGKVSIHDTEIKIVSAISQTDI